MNLSSYAPIHSPSARQPRHEHAPLSVLGAYQVGRAVRTWLFRNAGAACLVAGWLVALPIVFIPNTSENSPLIVGAGFVGAVLISFAVGWIIRGCCR